MHSARNDDKLLIASLQTLEQVFAEIAGVSLLTMNHQHRRFDFLGVNRYRHIREVENRAQGRPGCGAE